MSKQIHIFTFIIIAGIVPALFTIDVDAQRFPGFDTNLEKRSIDLGELIDGGPDTIQSAMNRL